MQKFYIKQNVYGIIENMDRSQNIFTLGMFIVNIYYLLIALWTSLSFFLMSAEKDMMDFTREDFLDK